MAKTRAVKPIKFTFLSKELNKNLDEILDYIRDEKKPNGTKTKNFISYWNQTLKTSEKQAKEIEAKGLTPGKYREGDIGVYMAPEWEDVQDAKLLDDGELRTPEFYRGVISGILLRHKKDSRGRCLQWAAPIAYCVSQLERLISLK